MKTTTWNTVCHAATNLDGNFDGLDPVEIEEDFPVSLILLGDVSGYLEICRPGGDTIYTLPADGRATSLSDWIVPFPADARDREGIAVPADILRYL